MSLLHPKFECYSAKKFWNLEFQRMTGHQSLPRDLSPLRFPGGKGSLKYFLANTILINNLKGGILIEPFCGGAGASLPLLTTKIIKELYLNDANPAVIAFWHSVFHDTDAIISLISTTPITIPTWHQYRDITKHPEQASTLELGFATFFMNRCNRSGLIHSGPIGGYKQTGNYKIDCRFNREALITRIKTIAQYRDHVHISNQDAQLFLDNVNNKIINKSLIFIDPPYVTQGSHLYKNFAFKEENHRQLAEYIKTKEWRWLITYDDHPLIHQIYAERTQGVVEFSYQMQQAKFGLELFIASSWCRIPFPKNTITPVDLKAIKVFKKNECNLA